jgi:hypothetical protein
MVHKKLYIYNIFANNESDSQEIIMRLKIFEIFLGTAQPFTPFEIRVCIVKLYLV